MGPATIDTAIHTRESATSTKPRVHSELPMMALDSGGNVSTFQKHHCMRLVGGSGGLAWFTAHHPHPNSRYPMIVRIKPPFMGWLESASATNKSNSPTIRSTLANSTVLRITLFRSHRRKNSRLHEADLPRHPWPCRDRAVSPIEHAKPMPSRYSVAHSCLPRRTMNLGCGGGR